MLVCSLYQGALLQQLATEIQRYVLAVNHSANESKPLGQYVPRLGLNQNSSTVETDARFKYAHAVHLRQLFGHVEETSNAERRVGDEVKRVTRLVKSIRNELIKFLYKGETI